MMHGRRPGTPGIWGNCYVQNFGREFSGIHEIPAGIPGNLQEFS